MTDEYRGPESASGSPWSVDVLADLHAGVLDEREAAELWPLVNADPEARAILEALDATTTDLGALAAEPAPPMPAEVAARIDAALTREAEARGGNVMSLDAARKRRNRRAGMGAAFLAAAAAAVAAVVIVVPGGPNDEPGIAAPEQSSAEQAPSEGEADAGEPSFAVDPADPAAALGDIEGVRDFGPLEPAEFDACLDAAGIDPGGPAEGVRPATIDGEDAVIALYTTGELARFRMIAVAADCGPDNPEVLLDETVGR